MDKLDVYNFGQQLLDSGDLDPVYIVLCEAQLARNVLYRWLTAYWCFYSVGTASWATGIGGEDAYWQRMLQAAGSKEWPRCHERRHFRGQKAINAVEWLAENGIDSLWGGLLGLGSCTAAEVMAYVQEWPMFGPWIGFKVADMLERLGILPVEFDNGPLLIFDSPRQGAELMWAAENEGEPVDDVVGWAVDKLVNHFSLDMAPPRYERTVNVQEAETVLCKHKSYMGGHYHIGEDIIAVRSGLLKFPRCRTSQQLLAAGRKVNLWQ